MLSRRSRIVRADTECVINDITTVYGWAGCLISLSSSLYEPKGLSLLLSETQSLSHSHSQIHRFVN